MDAVLKTRALRAGDELDGAPAEEILSWAVDEFGTQLVVAASMAEAILVDMLAEDPVGRAGGVHRHRLPLRRDHRDA